MSGTTTNTGTSTRASAHRDHIWYGELAIPSDELASLFGDARRRARITGHFAAHWKVGARDVLVRDPMGVHKLFYAIDRGELSWSRRARDLVEQGHPFSAIASVPSGHWAEIDPVRARVTLQCYASPSYGDPDAPMDDLAGHAARIRAALTSTFERLARQLRGSPVFVTLSGGLDSSTIAALAKEHLGASVRAITFTTPDSSRVPEGDLHHARIVAAHLGIPLDVIEAEPSDLVALVDRAIVEGQDFRDFNVHCALVNCVLASTLPRGTVVLSGDGMNELLSDYTPVEHAGRSFYGLPRLDPGRLRRFLVAGLDSGDREVGPFAARGVDVIQPYLLCADAYTRLPGGFLSQPGAKQELARLVVGERVPAAIYERPKVRAQVGREGEPGGVLAALTAANVDQRELLARFARLFATSEPEARAFIRGGLYRSRADRERRERDVA